MNWFVLALISSMALSLRESFAKKNTRTVPPMFMAWAMNLIMFIIMLALIVMTRRVYALTGSYMSILITAAMMDACAMILYLTAIKGGNLSKTIPMLCFIPVVQLFVTPVLVHENLSTTGIAGVLIVVSGSYLLNMEKWDRLASPFKAIFKDKNVFMMLLTACIWGVSSSFHKMGVQRTNSLFWGVTETAVITLFLFPVVFYKERKAFFEISHFKNTFGPAFFSAIAVLTYYTAIGYGPVAYVSSVRRLGVLFSMLSGMVLFKERIRLPAFSGGMIMITGAVIITLFG